MPEGMKHEPVIAKPIAEMPENELGAWMLSLPPAPGIRHIDDAEDDARALEDLAAGRVHDHAVVARWLLTAGDSDWKPFREWLAGQDG